MVSGSRIAHACADKEVSQKYISVIEFRGPPVTNTRLLNGRFVRHNNWETRALT